MPKKTPAKPADSLLKTNKKKDIELTEKELGKVHGGTSKLTYTPSPLDTKGSP